MFKIKQLYEEIPLLDRFMSKVRYTCYSLMHEIMSQYMCSEAIYKLLILLETF